MSKPDKPIEAQGLGCGLVLSLLLMTFVLIWIGIPPGPAILIAMVLAALSLVGYMVNQFKAQRVLDQTYKNVTKHPAMPPALPTPPIEKDGHGKYCVVGVDKETGMDTTWYVNADSAANAKVKGELQGIVVTQVTRV